MKKDIDSSSAIQQLLDPDTVTGNGTDTLSAACDLQGYEGGCLLIASVGASADSLAAGLNFQFEVQESEDDSTYTAVANADLTRYVTGTNTGTFALIDAGTEDDAAYKTQYIGSKRYVKVNVNLTGNHASGTPISVLALKLDKKYSPA